MTFTLGLLAFLVLPLIGLATWRIDSVGRMDIAGRLAVAAAAGALLTGFTMAMWSLLGIQWARWSLLLPLGAISAAGLVLARGPIRSTPTSIRSWPAISGTLIFSVLTAYGTLTARMSSGDLQYFWGPKGVRFFRAGGIDVEILRTADYYFMHPDYPPLVPLLYAWSNTASHHFSFWAAVAGTPILVLACAAIVRSLSGSDLDALLLAATLSLPMAVGFAAGAGEPLLLLFETLALAAVVFMREPRDQAITAAIGLAGATMTKIEGATFAIAFVLAMIIVYRRIKRPLAIVAPAAILVAGWVTFVAVAGFLDMYAAAGRYPVHLEVIPTVISLMVKAASYDALWLPWIAPIVLIILGDTRRAAFPVAVAILTLGAAAYFYVHLEDPKWWIETSAPRVLMTPLLALAVGAAAAWSDRATSIESEQSGRVVPQNPGAFRFGDR